MSQDKHSHSEEFSDNSNSSSEFSLELVVEKPKEEDKQVENAIDANIYDFDLDTIKDKPWLKPGADITDYFNYGFSEKSWKKYCEMQRENRAFTQEFDKRNYNEQRYDNRQEDRYFKRRRQDGDKYQKYNRRY